MVNAIHWRRAISLPLLLLLAAVFLAACKPSESIIGYTGSGVETGGPIARERNRPGGPRGDLAAQNAERPTGVNVNDFAWRASIDTLSFMPIRTSDPFGGVLATDWYQAQETPNERIRVNVRVGGPELTGDAVQVTVFRQVRNEQGNWEAASVNDRTARDLETVILTRARALRIEAESGN